MIQTFAVLIAFAVLDNNVVGSTAIRGANVISGNLNDGVLIASGGNQVQENLIGVNLLGTAAIPNSTGVYITGRNNQIGGTVAGQGNMISGNLSTGVDIFGPLRPSAAEVGLADGHAEGRLSQNRRGSRQGGMAPDPAFRPGAIWDRLGEFCRTALRAPPPE
jgi:hypothetical protein